MAFFPLRRELVTEVRDDPAEQDLTALDFLEELQVSLLSFGQITMRTPERDDIYAVGGAYGGTSVDRYP